MNDPQGKPAKSSVNPYAAPILAEVLPTDSAGDGSGLRVPTARIVFDFEFIAQTLKRYRSQRTVARFLSLFRAIVVVSLLVWAAAAFWNDRMETAILMTTAAVVMAVSWLLPNWSIRRLYGKLPNFGQEVVLKFTADGIYSNSDLQDSTIRWAMFTKAVYFDDGVLLLKGPKFMQWVPFHSLEDPSMIGELEALIRSKIFHQVDRRRH